VKMDLLEVQVQQDLLDHPALHMQVLDLQVVQEHLDLQVHLDHQVQQDHLVVLA